LLFYRNITLGVRVILHAVPDPPYRRPRYRVWRRPTTEKIISNSHLGHYPICSPGSRVECWSLVGRRSALAGPHPTALHKGPLLPMRRELVPTVRLGSRPLAREGKRPSGDRNVGVCLVRGWALHAIGGYGPKDIVVGRSCLHVSVHISGGVDRRGVYGRPAFPPRGGPPVYIVAYNAGGFTGGPG